MHGGHTPPRWELDGKFRAPRDFIRAAAETRSGKGLNCGFNDNTADTDIKMEVKDNIAVSPLTNILIREGSKKNIHF